MPFFDEHRRPAHVTPARPEPGCGPGRARTGLDPPIRIEDTGELIAAVPALIGFHPRDSLVLISTGGASGRRIGLTLRADLPPAQHLDLVVADAVHSLLADRPGGAAVILVGARPEATGHPPHAELADALVGELVGHGVEPNAVVWAESTTGGAAWVCYGPCGCSGRLPDPASTVVAAAAVAGGQVILADRAELERVVAPADPTRIRRRERLLVTRLEEAAGCAEPVDDATGLAVVDAAIAATAAGGGALDDQNALDLALALGDSRVRDQALLRNLGPAAGAAEQLWATLSRELPDPEAAEPAALLAVAALLRGDGALANVALDRAERAWPGHRLTRLLRRAADAGLPPGRLREWLAGPPSPVNEPR